MPFRLPWPLIACLALFFIPSATPAQEPAPIADPPGSRATEPQGAQSAGAGNEEVGPEVIHLWNGEKKLIAIPGFSYEDFLKYYRLKHQLEQPEIRPRYTVEELSIRGNAAGDSAELQFSMRVVVHDSGWVKIPVRLSQAILRDTPTYEGPGEQSFQAEESGGYSWWVRADGETDHTLKVNAVVPVVHSAGDNRLELTVPRSTISRLTLTVPSAKVEATSQGTAKPATRILDDSRSEITALGLVGQIALSWREQGSAPAGAPVLFAANSLVLSRLDGRSTQSQATMTVRSLGGEFQQFRVRLPPGAQLVGGQQPGYTLTPNATGNEVAVQLDSATKGPLEVRLITEQSYDVTRPDQWIELAGFEVIGAVRQWGQVAVAVAGDWKIVWGGRSRARQIDQWPASLASDDVVAAFELIGHASSLKVRTVPRIATLHVEPEYVCFVTPEQVRLEGKFKYQIRGGRVFSLSIDVQDWEIEDVGPAAVIGRNWSLEGTTLILPLAQPATGEIEVTVKARRPIRGPGDQLTISTPQPRTDVVRPASLFVVPADNIQLEPLLEQMAGLSPQTSPTSSAVRVGRQPALAYWTETGQAMFAARYRVLEQQIAIRATSDIQIAPGDARVAQRFAFDVAHEPLQMIELAAPRGIVARDGLVVRLDGESIVPDIRPSGSEESAELLRLQIALSKPRIGSFELSLDYALPLREFVPESTSPLAIPVAMPTQGTILNNEVSLRAAEGLHVEMRADQQWKPIAQPNFPTAETHLRIRSESAPTVVPLFARLGNDSDQGSTVIQKALVQTWLGDTARRDRALYRFTSAQQTLRVRLPDGIDPTSLDVQLNGKRLASTAMSEEVLTIQIAGNPDEKYLLDIRYLIPERVDHRGAVNLQLPHFQSAAASEQNYWELVLPASEHLLLTPEKLTPEFQWSWQGWHWGRTHAVRSEELVAQLGLADYQPSSPSNNRYVFSSLGVPTDVSLWTVSRSLLVFVASFAALIVGLIFIYVPVARHPVALLVAAILLTALSSLYPGPVVLIAQAASIGIALALMAGILRRATSRRQHSAKVVRSAPSSILERTSNEFYQRPSPSVSTATAPVVMDLASVQSKP